MKYFKEGLWTNRDFLTLWGSDSISVFGSQITLLALPLTAAILLRATPSQMGLLVACETLPFMLFSLFAGVLTDRVRRLPMLKLGNYLAALVLLVVPAAYLLDALSMPLLYVVGFLEMTIHSFMGVAYQAYVSTLVERKDLVDANGKLATSESMAQVGGPSVAGLLIQWFSAPLAILLDALSYVLCAWMLGGIKTVEPAPVRPAHRPAVLAQIREGIVVCWQNPILRWFIFAVGSWHFLVHIMVSLFVLYATRIIGLSPAWVGVIFAMEGVGALAASLTARRAADRFGVGRAIAWAVAINALGWIGLAFVQGSGMNAAIWLGASMLVIGFGGTMWIINYIALRQAITPEPLMGRVIGTMRFMAVSGAPLGALVGGALGETIGLAATFHWVAAGGVLLTIAAFFSPLMGLKSMPGPMQGQAEIPTA